MFRSALPAALAPAAALIAPQAIAHSYPQTTSPRVDGTVTKTPGQVTIVFTEGIEPRFSSIEVRDPNGQRVDEGAAHLVDGNAKRFAIGVKPLAPATYTVAWQATSVDTHKTSGLYHFTLVAAGDSDTSLDHVWARATAGTSTTGAAFLSVTDNGCPDHLEDPNRLPEQAACQPNRLPPISCRPTVRTSISGHAVGRMRRATFRPAN
jgi:copper resistance protein C